MGSCLCKEKRKGRQVSNVSDDDSLSHEVVAQTSQTRQINSGTRNSLHRSLPPSDNSRHSVKKSESKTSVTSYHRIKYAASQRGTNSSNDAEYGTPPPEPVRTSEGNIDTDLTSLLHEFGLTEKKSEDSEQDTMQDESGTSISYTLHAEEVPDEEIEDPLSPIANLQSGTLLLHKTSSELLETKGVVKTPSKIALSGPGTCSLRTRHRWWLPPDENHIDPEKLSPYDIPLESIVQPEPKKTSSISNTLLSLFGRAQKKEEPESDYNYEEVEKYLDDLLGTESPNTEYPQTGPPQLKKMPSNSSLPSLSSKESQTKQLATSNDDPQFGGEKLRQKRKPASGPSKRSPYASTSSTDDLDKLLDSLLF